MFKPFKTVPYLYTDEHVAREWMGSPAYDAAEVKPRPIVPHRQLPAAPRGVVFGKKKAA